MHIQRTTAGGYDNHVCKEHSDKLSMQSTSLSRPAPDLSQSQPQPNEAEEPELADEIFFFSSIDDAQDHNQGNDHDDNFDAADLSDGSNTKSDSDIELSDDEDTDTVLSAEPPFAKATHPLQPQRHENFLEGYNLSKNLSLLNRKTRASYLRPVTRASTRDSFGQPCQQRKLVTQSLRDREFRPKRRGSATRLQDSRASTDTL